MVTRREMNNEDSLLKHTESAEAKQLATRDLSEERQMIGGGYGKHSIVWVNIVVIEVPECTISICIQHT